MCDFIQAATEKTAELARQTTLYAGNAFDRVFRSASMVQAGQTPFETLYTDGLVSLRYYPPLQEGFIKLDGITIPVERNIHRTPVVIRVRKHSGQAQWASTVGNRNCRCTAGVSAACTLCFIRP